MKTTIRLFLAFVCLAAAGPKAQAVTPAPDGGYPGKNTAEGEDALFSLSSGELNTAVGWASLFYLHTGKDNTAIGVEALGKSANGFSNTAAGVFALRNNITGSFNTAVGTAALLNSTGSHNVALGYVAGETLRSGNYNVYIGAGVRGGFDEYETIRIGGVQHSRTFIAGISGVAVTGAAVLVKADGQLGVAASSARFKDEIKPMDKSSEPILALKPVTFRYNKDIDAKGIRQFGLVAEDVAKVNPDLVINDRDGKPFTVRYDAVNAMLLNEFLKEHRAFLKEQRKVEELEAARTSERKEIAALMEQLKAQAAAIQKVSAQLELSKPAPRTVADER